MSSKTDRLQIANAVLEAISRYGRRFFRHEGRVSRFEIAENGKLWYVDSWTQKRVYVMYRQGRWRHFTEGGTLRALVTNLADFIAKNEPVRNHFGPWSQSTCGGDLWGYGEAMLPLRAELHAIFAPTQEEAALRRKPKAKEQA